MMERTAARELCEQVLHALEPIFPEGVTVTVRRTIRGWELVRTPESPDADAERMAARIREMGGIPGPVIRVNLYKSPPIGTWIPLLPRSVRARLNLISVIELICDTVKGDSPSEAWPLPGVTVKTRIQAGRVMAWFEAPDGTRISAGDFALQSCL